MWLTRQLLPILLCLFAGSSAHALTIDSFVDDGFISSTATVGTTKATHISSAQAVGGGRTLSATKSGAGTGVSRLEVVDSSLGYTQGAHAGFASITWDGDTDTASTKPNGLGSVDLTQDEGTAFKLGLAFFDYPSNQPVSLKLRIYDSSTPNGSKFSEVSILLDQFYGGPDVFYITIPFSMFSTAGTSSVAAPLGLTFSTTTTLGSGGAADVTRVGAISLAFRGDLNSRAPDIILAPFKTNGKCAAVPDSNGKAIDECSVCHEDANAKKGTDRCGVCYAGPNGYSYETNKSFDSCGLCPGEANYQFPTGVMDKCGTCVGGPAPYTYVDTRDVCGVCGGTTIKKADCTVSTNGCPLVKPTAKILSFEKRLVEKATLLRTRYQADVQRAKVRKCPLSFTDANKRVNNAYSAIKTKSASVFRSGIEVCTGSCVTVSYAHEVEALEPQFKTLENEASKAARQVQECYTSLGIFHDNTGTGSGGTARTVASVRTELGNLIRECRKTNVCKKP